MFKFVKKIIPTKVKAKIKVFLKMSKLRSITEFNFKESYFAHNQEYEEEEAFKREFEIQQLKTEQALLKKGIWNNVYDNSNSVGFFLERNNSITKLIDIGSGTGWFVNFVSDNFNNIKSIYGIEPSSAAIALSKKIYKEKDSITYLNDFAHIALSKLDKDVYLITTFAVFQHLPRRYTKKIIKSIDNICLKGSKIIFNEPIGESNLNNYRLHYARTKNFYTKNLKNFNVEFKNKNTIIATKL